MSASNRDLSVNDRQVGGDHYRLREVQHWDYVRGAGIPYLEAMVMKYIDRWRHKNGLQDLEKALHFAQKLRELSPNKEVPVFTLHHYTRDMHPADAEIITLVAKAIYAGSGRSVDGHSLLEKVENKISELISLETGEEPGPGYVNQDPDLRG